MAIEMEGAEAAEAAQELIQTGWQGGIFNPRGKTVARARAASAKGGRMPESLDGCEQPQNLTMRCIAARRSTPK